MNRMEDLPEDSEKRPEEEIVIEDEKKGRNKPKRHRKKHNTKTQLKVPTSRAESIDKTSREPWLHKRRRTEPPQPTTPFDLESITDSDLEELLEMIPTFWIHCRILMTEEKMLSNLKHVQIVDKHIDRNRSMIHQYRFASPWPHSGVYRMAILFHLR